MSRFLFVPLWTKWRAGPPAVWRSSVKRVTQLQLRVRKHLRPLRFTTKCIKYKWKFLPSPLSGVLVSKVHGRPPTWKQEVGSISCCPRPVHTGFWFSFLNSFQRCCNSVLVTCVENNVVCFSTRKETSFMNNPLKTEMFETAGEPRVWGHLEALRGSGDSGCRCCSTICQSVAERAGSWAGFCRESRTLSGVSYTTTIHPFIHLLLLYLDWGPGAAVSEKVTSSTSSRHDVSPPGTPLHESVQKTTQTDEKATSGGSSWCGGAAAPLQAHFQVAELLTMSPLVTQPSYGGNSSSSSVGL